MYGLKELLEKENMRLSKINEVINNRLIDVPEGEMVCSSSHGKWVYKLKSKDEKGKRREKYIKKENMKMIRDLAQKEYNLRLKRLVEHRLKQISRLNKEYRDEEIEEIYNNLHDAKREIISPVELTWEQRVNRWKNMKYTGKEFSADCPIIYSKKGERVRSKSEKILADTFYDMGIEYKYECPIRLKGYGIVYPDFTFMSKRCNGVMYWEHDGRMDDPQYAVKAVRKIDSYIRNGIFPGERLIITYETSNYTLNEKVVKEYIEKYLI